MSISTIIGLVTLAILAVSTYSQIPPESKEIIEARKRYGGVE